MTCRPLWGPRALHCHLLAMQLIPVLLSAQVTQPGAVPVGTGGGATGTPVVRAGSPCRELHGHTPTDSR